jgi:hypothetical protein
MTKRVASPYGPQISVREREDLMPADAQVACQTDYGVEVFDRVIQVTVASGGNVARKYALRLEGEAKAICAGCPVRLTCLRVYGPSPLAFGVVGGLTDAERAVLFGGETA